MMKLGSSYSHSKIAWLQDIANKIPCSCFKEVSLEWFHANHPHLAINKKFLSYSFCLEHNSPCQTFDVSHGIWMWQPLGPTITWWCPNIVWWHIIKCKCNNIAVFLLLHTFSYGTPSTWIAAILITLGYFLDPDPGTYPLVYISKYRINHSVVIITLPSFSYCVHEKSVQFALSTYML